MKVNKKQPPRKFLVGAKNEIEISDHGTIYLKENDQISFITKDSKEYDIVRKDWGFYATPSINGRLVNQGFKTALVKNIKGMFYVMLVEKNKIGEFEKYLIEENNSFEKF